HLVRAVQPPQGEPAAARDQDGADDSAEAAGAGALYQARYAGEFAAMRAVPGAVLGSAGCGCLTSRARPIPSSVQIAKAESGPASSAQRLVETGTRTAVARMRSRPVRTKRRVTGLQRRGGRIGYPR